MKKTIKVDYVLMCDDVRREDSGKYIFIGAYNEDMIVPKETPIFVSPLSFFIHVTMPRGVAVPVVTWLENPSGVRTDESDWGELRLPDEMKRPTGQIIWKLLPWRSTGLGKYKLHLSQRDVDSVIHEFEIQTT